MAAVRWTAFFWSSLGKLSVALSVSAYCTSPHALQTHLFTFPRWRAALFRGKKAREPWRGASNLGALLASAFVAIFARFTHFL